MTPDISNSVYCYYTPSGLPGQSDLLALWVKTWARQGWSTVILNETIAKLHPRYAELKEAIPKLPKPSWYYKDLTMACFIRYAAMAVVGGGLMVDYDVMNRSFKPEHFTRRDFHLQLNRSAGEVFGSKDDFERIVELVAHYPPSMLKNHNGLVLASDMYILMSLGLPRSMVSRVFLDQGWENSPLVHFDNSSAMLIGKNQYDAASQFFS